MTVNSDKLKPGDQYDALELHVSSDLNKQYLKALNSNDERYEKFIHPGLILNFSSITQSPSFKLESEIAAVGAKFESIFYKPAKVGSRLRFEWAVTETYERRSRVYQLSEIQIKCDGSMIMKRKITNTFIGGEYLDRRVKWEKEKAYRRSVPISSFPKQGYEIIGIKRKLSLEQMSLFSGGAPGPLWPVRNIHTDREISIRSGIGRPIASGLMFEAYLMEMLINFCGDRIYNSGNTKTVAIDMAGDGDTIIPKMVLKEPISQINSSGMIADIWCENQYGNKIMIGGAIL